MGGTNVKYGVVDAHGAMLWGARVATPAQRPLPVLAITDIAAAALDRAVQDGQVIAGLGVAAPGRVDSAAGLVLEAIEPAAGSGPSSARRSRTSSACRSGY